MNYCIIGNTKYKNLSNIVLSLNKLKKESLILNTIYLIHTSLFNNNVDNSLYIAHIYLSSHLLGYEFVKEGFGIGLVIKEFIKDKLDDKDLYEIKTKEKFQPLNLILIVNKDGFPTYATSQLINTIKNKEEK